MRNNSDNTGIGPTFVTAEDPHRDFNSIKYVPTAAQPIRRNTQIANNNFVPRSVLYELIASEVASSTRQSRGPDRNTKLGISNDQQPPNKSPKPKSLMRLEVYQGCGTEERFRKKRYISQNEVVDYNR